ncbi:MAG: VOC family protein [Lysobacteraceae bacterium]
MSLIAWVEIPVADFERALRFYTALLDAPLQVMELGDTRMGMFPGECGGGAIVQGEGNVPGVDGVRVYLSGGDDLSPMLARVAAAGGQIVVPKTEITPEFGYFALFHDSEGNCIGLHSSG